MVRERHAVRSTVIGFIAAVSMLLLVLALAAPALGAPSYSGARGSQPAAGSAIAPGSAAGPAAGVSDAPKVTGVAPGTKVITRLGRFTGMTPPIVERPSVSVASATFVVTYTGFTPQAQAAFQAAINLWASRITTTQTIRVNASWSALGATSGILGQAGPDNFARINGVWYPIALAEAMCNCVPAGVTSEISAEFNNQFTSWYLGTDGAATGSQIDFESVVLHELGHGLGLIGTFSVASGSGSWNASYPMMFDSMVWSEQSGGGRLQDTGFVANPSTTLGTHLTDGSVWFGGTATSAANGGARARLYAPATWSGGSSIYHLDDTAYPRGSAGALMTHAIEYGEVIHAISPITLAMYEDLGWSTSPGDTTPPTWTAGMSPSSAAFTKTAASVAWSWNAATDPGGVGLAASPYTVRIDTAPLTGGTCGSVTTGTPVAQAGLSASVASPVSGTCYTAVVTAKDRSGNTTAAATGGTWRYDATAPTATVTVTDSSAAMAVSGTTLYVATPAAGQTFNATYTVTDSSGVSTYTCPTVGGFSVVQSMSAPWVCSYTATGSGYAATTATASFTDNAGNSANVAAFTVTRDTTAPTATVAIVESVGALATSGTTLFVGSPTVGQTFTATYTVTETGSGVPSLSCPAVGGFTPAVSGTGPFVCTYTATGSGYAGTTASATIADAVGNSTSTTFTVTRDTTAPTATVALAESNSWMIRVGTVLTVGAAPAGQTFTATYTVTESGSGSPVLTCPTVAGFDVAQSGSSPTLVCTYTSKGSGYAAATATGTIADAVGNSGSASAFSVVLDTTAPVVSVVLTESSTAMSVSGLTITVGTPAVGQTFTATYTVVETGAGLTSFACPSIGGFSGTNTGSVTAPVCVYTATGAGFGSVTATATATDWAGNVGTKDFSFVRDTTAPTATVVLNESSGALSVSGTTLQVLSPAAGQTFTATYTASEALTALSCPAVAGFTSGQTGSGPYVCTYTATGSGYTAGTPTATFTDLVANSGSTPFTVSLDAAPTATVVLAESSGTLFVSGTTIFVGTPAASQTFTATYTASEALASFTCPTVGGFTVAKTGTGPYVCTFTATGSGYGSATATATFTDGTANGGSTDFTVTRDVTGPTATMALNESSPVLFASGTTLTIATPGAGQSFTATATITESGSGAVVPTCPDLAGFNVARSGSLPAITCTYTATGSGYAAATPSMSLIDQVGNAGSVGFTVTRDTAAPTSTVVLDESSAAMSVTGTTITVGSPAAGQQFTATYSASEPLSGFACPAVSGFSSGLSGTYVCTYTATGSGYAGGTASATLTDRVGNAGSVAFTVSVDSGNPTATVVLAESSGALFVSGTTIFVGTPATSQTFTATYTASEALASFTCPDVPGFTKGKTGTGPYVCTYTATGSGYGSATATATFTDGTATPGSTPFTVTRDTTGPVTTWIEPVGETSIYGGLAVFVDWTESDGAGAGVASRSLQRLGGPVVTPATCAGVTFAIDGAPSTAPGMQAQHDVQSDWCYRFTQTLTDRVGNVAVGTSGSQMVDATDPTIEVALAESSAAMDVTGSTLAVATPAAGQAFTATYTVVERGSGLRGFTCPTVPGFDVAKSGSLPTIVCTFAAQGSGYGGTTATVDVLDDIGNGASASFTVIRDVTAPAITFTSPADGLTVIGTGSQQVAWTVVEDGSGVASRSLQRQAGVVVEPGVCTGVSWADDGDPMTGASPRTSDGLTDSHCYRWTQTIVDKLGNTGSATSGNVLVDTLAPTGDVTLATDSGEIAVDGTTLTVKHPAAGQAFTATYAVTETGSGTTGISCPSLAGFSVEKTAPLPDAVCRYAALGTGYLAGTVTAHVADEAGNGLDLSFGVRLTIPTPALGALPTGWLSKDIGVVGQAGTAAPVTGTTQWFGEGAGKGFSALTDSFRLTSKAMTGAGSVTMRVVDWAGPSELGLVGTMVRDGTTTGGRFVFIGRHADGTVDLIKRTKAGTKAVTVSIKSAAPLGTSFRITRAGNVFTAAYKLPGGTWKTAGTVTMTLPSVTRAGIAETSRSTSAHADVVWDSVKIVP